jgi:hypothetical protein
LRRDQRCATDACDPQRPPLLLCSASAAYVLSTLISFLNVSKKGGGIAQIHGAITMAFESLGLVDWAPLVMAKISC